MQESRQGNEEGLDQLTADTRAGCDKKPRAVLIKAVTFGNGEENLVVRAPLFVTLARPSANGASLVVAFKAFLLSSVVFTPPTEGAGQDLPVAMSSTAPRDLVGLVEVTPLVVQGAFQSRP